MKVDSKHITPLIDTIKLLVGDFSENFREFDDLDQCKDCFEDLHKQLKEVLSHFKIAHLVPIVSEIPKYKLPQFVRVTDKILTMRKYKIETKPITDEEDRMMFMTQVYFMIKKKLEYDNVDHLISYDKIHHHMLIYFVSNDNDWRWYLETELSDTIYQVIDTMIKEIFEARRKAPQMVLKLDAIPTEETIKESKKLIDLI